ncbi:HAMP domain-containing sensor histidine kinase [Microcoleus sp. herbarium19]|uniref:sensor histidine kinase n=1 Tax=unclassified Microcoleus TaxID=2642155 RepID=UPI002FCF12DE
MQFKHLDRPSPELPTSCERNIKDSHSPKDNYFAQIARSFGNLSISDKICRGYALALCVAIGGTTVGMLAGNHYYRRTNNQVHIDGESRLLNKLQVALLRTQNSQERLIDWLEQPQIFDRKYRELQDNTYSLKLSLSELKIRNAADIEGLQEFRTNYGSLLFNYVRQLETVTEKISKLAPKSNKKSVKRKLLSNLDRDRKIGLQLDRAANDLAEIIDRVQEQEDAAQEALLEAQALRVRIIVGSIGLSIVVAALLASYTSRAIAKPIAAVTKIAQRVTEESNFQLQVPVTSTDEVGVLATSLNQLIQKVNHLLQQLKSEQESQILQNEKMASLGRMLAGIAHEVNNPINFIYANIEPAKNYVEDILDLLKTYETEIPNPPPAVIAKAEDIDIDFLKEDLMKIFDSMQVGAERAKAIILSLKDFSRLDDATPHPVDLHACIDSSLLILNSRIKQGIEVVKNYGNIPNIEGYMGLLYQVFVNLINNALDAVEEKAKLEKNRSEEGNQASGSESAKQESPRFSPRIAIATEYLDDDSVVVRISDNGTGIAPASQEKMFETFFTTKPRGVGTGLGLAIGREIIVKKHGGTINCWSEVGTGTEFAIALPIKRY